MLTEIRIESLGAISTATAEFDRGLTVLTGETGTGKTMVVTGLQLLGGARADPTRVRSGADRAVVEGRFTTTDLDDATVARLDEILDASGAQRDEDDSVIALRSVSGNGPSRAYLGGRSVPAKSLSGFTNELLALHGQNDQLRLLRPDEQRGAVDRFAASGPACERYRKLRDTWLSARRDLSDRRNRRASWPRRRTGCSLPSTRSTRSTRSRARTRRWSLTSCGSPSWTPCARPRRWRARHCPARPMTRSASAPPNASGAPGRLLNRPTIPRCGRWPIKSARR
ncbi:AAA domain protein [Mycobacterium kansasii 824]|nr:AAA domain protein [Mycobacterium kansasii 824]